MAGSHVLLVEQISRPLTSCTLPTKATDTTCERCTYIERQSPKQKDKSQGGRNLVGQRWARLFLAHVPVAHAG